MSMQMTETTHVSFRPLRSAGALIAGFAVVVALSMGTDAVLHSTGIYPPLDQPQGTWTLVGALIYRTAFTMTALLAPRNGLKHAVILGAIGTVFGALGAVSMWSYGDHWYPIALTLLALPSTWFGGWLRSHR